MTLRSNENLNSIQALTYELSDKIEGAFPNGFGRLVTVGQVGAHMGNIIGRELQLDDNSILGVKIARTVDTTGDVVCRRFVDAPSAVNIDGQATVVIDGVCRSGGTLDKVTKYLTGCGAVSVHTGVLFCTSENATTGIHVPTWSMELRETGDDNLLFPWNDGRPASSPKNVVYLNAPLPSQS